MDPGALEETHCLKPLTLAPDSVPLACLLAVSTVSPLFHGSLMGGAHSGGFSERECYRSQWGEAQENPWGENQESRYSVTRGPEMAQSVEPLPLKSEALSSDP